MACPICKRPAEPLRPFCSRRCADVDLGRWLTGAYAVPAGEDEPDEEIPRPASGQRWRAPSRTRLAPAAAPLTRARVAQG